MSRGFTPTAHAVSALGRLVRPQAPPGVQCQQTEVREDGGVPVPSFRFLVWDVGDRPAAARVDHLHRLRWCQLVDGELHGPEALDVNSIWSGREMVQELKDGFGGFTGSVGHGPSWHIRRRGSKRYSLRRRADTISVLSWFLFAAPAQQAGRNRRVMHSPRCLPTRTWFRTGRHICSSGRATTAIDQTAEKLGRICGPETSQETSASRR